MGVVESDFLVLGSGIAGLSAASQLAPLGSVSVVTKDDLMRSNSSQAQGGIASVTDPTDSFQSHVKDTLEAGAGLCREEVVRGIVSEGPACIERLVAAGVRFSGGALRPDLGLEGGHSQRRILHAGDLTGFEIQRALAELCRAEPKIRLYEGHAAVDLILERHPSEAPPSRNRCLGAYVLAPDGKVTTFRARAVILATGGAGRVYLYTTNPDVATGDGMAMAFRAGLELRNLEFVQFHPTCLYNPGVPDESGRRFLLSEALRGEGGVLLTLAGKRLMEGAHPLKDLAPRDIVARAIDAEMKRTGAPHLWLDMSSRPRSFLEERFPTIFKRCSELGLDMSKDPLPIVPAAHFFCGGVETAPDGRTAMPGLFAAGETAHTGLHGANRLASNSLLEGAVVAHRIAEALARDWEAERRRPQAKVSDWDTKGAVPSDEAVIVEQNWDAIRRLTWNYVGIVRSERRLRQAQERLAVVSREVSDYYWRFLLTRDVIELRNIALLAELTVGCALSRRESRGLHYTVDYPRTLEAENRDSVASRGLGRTLAGQEAGRP
ncbi:MAG: L-aspartate oxidase [Elusimicrobia bacterium]|nr:L-aspartate oxidase [Elusimicrobiota bacterium]